MDIIFVSFVTSETKFSYTATNGLVVCIGGESEMPQANKEF